MHIKTMARWLILTGLWLCTAVAHAGTVTYIYTDPQGTPLAEADASGNITARFDYAPYGTAVASMSPAPNGPGYTGHVSDPDTGLVYMQARYYDPSVGRFLNTDPVTPSAGNAFSFNRYAYANNNPIVNIDPDGRCPDGDMPGGCGYIARSDAQHPEATRALGPYAAGATIAMAGVTVGYAALAALPAGTIVFTRLSLATAFCSGAPLVCNAQWLNKFNPQYEPDQPAETTVLENRKLLNEIEELMEELEADESSKMQQLPPPPSPQPTVAPTPTDPTIPNPEVPAIPPADPPPTPQPIPPQLPQATPQSS